MHVTVAAVFAPPNSMLTMQDMMNAEQESIWSVGRWWSSCIWRTSGNKASVVAGDGFWLCSSWAARLFNAQMLVSCPDCTAMPESAKQHIYT